MTKAEEQEAIRKDRLARLNAAWAELALLPAFNVVLAAAQQHFGMFQPSFSPTDQFNPHAAAQRDGQKSVLAYFLRRHAHGAELAEDETAGEKPRSAI